MPEITPRDSPCFCINARRAAQTLTRFYDQAFTPVGLTANQFSLLNDIFFSFSGRAARASLQSTRGMIALLLSGA